MAKPKLTALEEIKKAFPLMQISGIGGIARNPFSGETEILTAEGLALYNAVKYYEVVYNSEFPPSKQAYRDFRKSLDLFRKLYPSEYMTLLD